MAVFRKLVAFLCTLLMLAGLASAQTAASITDIENRANAGEASAMVELGDAYQNGKGVAANRETAIIWYLRAAEQNDVNGFFLAAALIRTRAAPGDHQRALELLEASLTACLSEAWRASCAAASIWREISSTQHDLAQYREALASLDKAASLAAAEQPPNEALLTEIHQDRGLIFNSLSLYNDALAEFEQAKLQFAARHGAESEQVARVLLSMGGSHERLNQMEKSLTAKKQALAIFSSVLGPEASQVGITGNNIGWTLLQMGQFEHSYQQLELALASMRRHFGPESYAVVWPVTNMGMALERQGRFAEAITLNMKALVLATRHKKITLEPKRYTLQSLSKSYKGLGNSANAILFAKMAVNAQQQIRAQNAGLEESQSKSFTEEWRGLYQELADLLIGEGRIAEAQYVLDLLKQQELIEFVRRDSSASTEARAANLTTREQATFDSLDAAMQRPMALAVELEALDTKQRNGALTQEEEARLAEVSAALDKSYDVFLTEVDALLQASSTEAAYVQDEIKALNLEYAADRQEQLRNFSRPTVLLQAASMEENLNLFLTTKDISVHKKVPVRREDLARMVFATLDAVKARDPAADKKLAELYAILVKPLEVDLHASGAEVVMLNLGGFLRYLPFAALRSERGYFIEDYALALDTPAAQTKFETVQRDRNASAGFGVTAEHPGFSPLPGVATELETIFEGSDTKGELFGQPSLDSAFTEESFKDALKLRPQLLHVASHFRFVPGNENDSFLLLGNGAALSLNKIRKGRGFRFGGVDLLTLSACETASGGGEGDEVESFGALAQMNGASAVMATLWPIADGPTGQLMADFYQGLIEGDLDKASALRRAQLAMLKDMPAANVKLNQRSAVSAEDETDPEADFAPVTTRHPYYWAAFIIMGNWL